MAGWTDYSSAPPPGTLVCPEEAVTGVQSLMVTSDRGSFPLLLLRVAGDLRAYVNACPHQYLPLDYRGGQILSADGQKLMCTAHGASFCAATGDVLAGADCGLDAVPITCRDGMVFIG